MLAVWSDLLVRLVQGHKIKGPIIDDGQDRRSFLSGN